MILRAGFVTILGALFVLSAQSSAAPPAARDPDWPCQQIKVPESSPAAIWSGPVIDPQQTEWKQDQQVVDLVQQITPRRVPIETAKALIEDFAQRANGEKKTRMMALLAGLFTTFNQERDSVMAGLDRFGRRQRQLASDIRSDNEKLHAAQTNATADEGAIAKLTQQVSWEVEVFQDRARR